MEPRTLESRRSLPELLPNETAHSEVDVVISGFGAVEIQGRSFPNTSMVRAFCWTLSIGVTTTRENGVSRAYGIAGSPFGTECHWSIQVPYSCGNRATCFNMCVGQPVRLSYSAACVSGAGPLGKHSINSWNFRCR